MRQLEALVRLSEALARLRCTEKIVPAYVREVCSSSSVKVTSCDYPEPSSDVSHDKHPAQVQSCSQKSTCANCCCAYILSDKIWYRSPDICLCLICQRKANPCAMSTWKGPGRDHTAVCMLQARRLVKNSIIAVEAPDEDMADDDWVDDQEEADEVLARHRHPAGAAG